MIPRWVPIAAIAGAIFAAAALGWWLGQPKPVQETAAPEVRQADGSVVLERRPDPAAKPKQHIPRKATVERVAQVTVQPDAIAQPGKPCPPVTIDMTMIREPDGMRRVLASSPDGQVVGGLDIPVESAALPTEPKRWGVGLSWSVGDQTAGVWVERDVPVFSKVVRLGVEVNQARVDTHATGADVRLRVGFAF